MSVFVINLKTSTVLEIGSECHDLTAGITSTRPNASKSENRPYAAGFISTRLSIQQIKIIFIY